jgi:hypothetical protein
MNLLINKIVTKFNMIYIRNIFTQDLRDGKQIAFPTEPSNILFKFSFSNKDADRKISFKFKEKDNNSPFYVLNGKTINTRLYSAGSEARIDGELKLFLKVDLSAEVGDIIIIRAVNLELYEFEFLPKTAVLYNSYKTILNGKNHEVAIIQINDEQINESSKLTSPQNTIYYGAPGTGKSYKIEKIIEKLDSKYYERITFHPEYDNSSFIGGYKPISDKVKYSSEEGEYFVNEVQYKFVPQAFTNIYERAWQDLDNQYYLVIEEINRGNCAEIFGEIFQLLDRTSNYTVSPSKELKEHLENDAFKDINHIGIANGLKLPPNLSILATMNTSDQSLFPMDSAFKRRWDWEYIPICYDDIPENESFAYVVNIDKTTSFKWIDFIKNVNAIIKTNLNLGMDKCIGNYFIKSDSKEISSKEFINKAIFYLWNDVFKDEDSSDSIFEKGTSYEDFFPIDTNGKKEIEKILKYINIEPTIV